MSSGGVVETSLVMFSSGDGREMMTWDFAHPALCFIPVHSKSASRDRSLMMKNEWAAVKRSEKEESKNPFVLLFFGESEKVLMQISVLFREACVYSEGGRD